MELSFIGACPLGLLIVFVITGIAMWALGIALDGWDFLFLRD